ALASPAVGRAQMAETAAPDARIPAAAARSAAETITANDLRGRLSIIAADSMRGRATPSPGLRMTAEYVADQFASFGLEPGAGDGAWLQEYPLTTLRPGDAAEQQAIITGPDGSWNLSFGDDWLAQYESAFAEGDGDIVVVRVGEDNPDVTGRIVALRVTLENLQQVFGGGLGQMLEGDPAGVLLSLDVPENFMNRLRRFLEGGRTQLGEPSEDSIPYVLAVHSHLPAPFAALLADGGDATGWSAHLQTSAQVETDSAPNTIGILRGSDPELADEYVMFTAHMDHLGVARDVEAGADSIFNGADDDGSGTVTIVELAQAFASLETAPRRSLVFMTVSGEERGLLGSQWYSEHPTVPLASTVADFNIDMIGRNWPDTIVAIGKEESTLGPLVESIAAAHPELDMQVIDDLWPEESFYTRSDHYNFARKGVPILFFFNGVHDDYHQVSDEVGKIGYDKMSRIGRLVFYTGLAVAEADEPPRWDADAYARVVEDAATAGDGEGDEGGGSR
ncbi:MAG: M28 family peptidase, partial [Gemmatimonadales bacterium]